LPDPARADHQGGEAALRLRGVEDGADAGERGAAEQRRLLDRNGVAERHRGGGVDDDPLGERAGRGAPVDRLAAEREAGTAAEERAAPDRRRERPARRRPAAPARAAVAARGRPGEDDAVALTQPGDLGAQRLDDPGALVPEHDRRRPVPLALVRMEVRAADADGIHPDDDVARQRLLDVELLDDQRARLVHHRGARPHRISMPPLTSSVAPVTKPAASEAR
jgi:hypothetical protein